MSRVGHARVSSMVPVCVARQLSSVCHGELVLRVGTWLLLAALECPCHLGTHWLLLRALARTTLGVRYSTRTVWLMFCKWAAVALSSESVGTVVAPVSLVLLTVQAELLSVFVSGSTIPCFVKAVSVIGRLNLFSLAVWLSVFFIIFVVITQIESVIVGSWGRSSQQLLFFLCLGLVFDFLSLVLVEAIIFVSVCFRI